MFYHIMTLSNFFMMTLSYNILHHVFLSFITESEASSLQRVFLDKRSSIKPIFRFHSILDIYIYRHICIHIYIILFFIYIFV